MTDVVNPKSTSPDQLLPYHKKISAEGKALMKCFISYTYMVLKDNTIGTVAYLDGYIILYAAGVMTSENIADELVRQCSGDRIPIPQSEINDLEDFSRMQEKLRLRLINYAANFAELEKIPHRKFLDLAVTYYLDIDMEPGKGMAPLSFRMD